MISHFIIAFLVLCLPVLVEAKTLYVDNTGSCSDATSYVVNGSGARWCTIARAAWGSTTYASPNTGEAAQAGDTVLITSGTYWENGDTGGGRFSVSLNPANSGTAGNLITFRGVGTVYVRLNGPGNALPAYRGAMIGCASVNYILWDHLIIDDYYGGSTSDTGPVVFSNSNHCQLINSEVIAHPGDVSTGTYFHGYPVFDANYRGISLEPDANFTLIKNNKIHGFVSAAAGILAYDSNDNVVEHNEVYGNKIGIYFKGLHVGKTMARNVVRFNLVHDNTHRGIQNESTSLSLVYQNVVLESGTACLYLGSLGGPDGDRWFNNTCVSTQTTMEGSVVVSGATVPTGPRNSNIINNIFVGPSCTFCYPIYENDGGFNPVEQNIIFNRNLWFGNTTARHVNCCGNPSFTTWQASPLLEDVDSISGVSPLFMGSGNYKLQVGSPARTLGRVIAEQVTLGGFGLLGDTIPAGAYVTGSEVIGVETSGSTGTTISGGVTFSGSVSIQ